jgi:hypothetical protein
MFGTTYCDYYARNYLITIIQIGIFGNDNIDGFNTKMSNKGSNILTSDKNPVR